MEAYVVEGPGGSFRKTDLPRPTLRPNHVLVQLLEYVLSQTFELSLILGEISTAACLFLDNLNYGLSQLPLCGRALTATYKNQVFPGFPFCQRFLSLLLGPLLKFFEVFSPLRSNLDDK